MKTVSNSFFEDRRSKSNGTQTTGKRLPKNVLVDRRMSDMKRAILNDHWYLKVNYAFEETNIKNILKHIRSNKN